MDLAILGLLAFIYIFVHALNASSYVKDVSKLDIFAWFNMSVIVFIFLFPIPIYFWSTRQQLHLSQPPQRQRPDSQACGYGGYAGDDEP